MQNFVKNIRGVSNQPQPEETDHLQNKGRIIADKLDHLFQEKIDSELKSSIVRQQFARIKDRSLNPNSSNVQKEDMFNSFIRQFSSADPYKEKPDQDQALESKLFKEFLRDNLMNSLHDNSNKEDHKKD